MTDADDWDDPENYEATPSGCNTLGHRSPWAARRDHRLSHEAPF